MRRAWGALFAGIALAACGQGPGEATQGTRQATEAAVAGGDPCALVADTAAVFGREVTAANEPMPNMCTWRSADAVVSGSIIMHGEGWSPVTDAQRAYDQMLEPLVGMATRSVPEIGDQAVAVDMGAGHAQVFFRKGGAAVNVGASSSDPSLTSAALAERIAREAANRL